MSLFSFGGFGGRYDEDLPSKVARFKDRHRGKQQEFEDFLRYDLGVDPNEIPATIEDFKTIGQPFFRRAEGVLRFFGNSLGLQKVLLRGEDEANKETADWDVLVKLYSALTTKFPGHFNFRVAQEEYTQEIMVVPTDEGVRSKVATDYPTGTLLRIKNAAGILYVRVGSFTDDKELINAETLQPVTHPETYTVIEVIE